MINQSLCILGRQPALGLAELASLYGGDKVKLFGHQAALIDLAPAIVNSQRLGGLIKLSAVITTLPTTNWKEVEKFLIGYAATLAEVTAGKLQLGLSAFGFSLSPRQLQSTGLLLKRSIRNSGRSVRLVVGQSLSLSSAQVIHNRLTGPSGRELVCVSSNDRTIIAQTIHEQDIAAYTLRDRQRPERDPRIGMLPPKLAQIITNLAVGNQQPIANFTVLDPFCGTGVLLQEAQLMGYSIYGTDREARMVTYSQTNLNWLHQRFKLNPPASRFEVADATTYQWPGSIGAVASEIYLGRPFTAVPTSSVLEPTLQDCDLITRKFLANISSQLNAGTRLCLAVPAWQIRPHEFRHLPVIDQIEELGYTRVSFEQVRPQDLLYYREDQIVARELLVIVRK